jgi:hypothetical protein
MRCRIVQAAGAPCLATGLDRVGKKCPTRRPAGHEKGVAKNHRGIRDAPWIGHPGPVCELCATEKDAGASRRPDIEACRRKGEVGSATPSTEIVGGRAGLHS